MKKLSSTRKLFDIEFAPDGCIEFIWLGPEWLFDAHSYTAFYDQYPERINNPKTSYIYHNHPEEKSHNDPFPFYSLDDKGKCNGCESYFCHEDWAKQAAFIADMSNV